ncbi:hypothetical protein VE04_09184 [Pseudogymnoascus sp. 24MN13]|nr:hypothetical protein VE04_09184 [Pseudogymnoascus sp. 24MN13]
MLVNYLVPALAVLGMATAAPTNPACKQTTVIISSQSDADALAGCTTFTGNIQISKDVPSGGIALNGIQQLNGDLIANQAVKLTALSATSLGSISGTIKFTSLTTMSSLEFPSLSQALTFTTGVTKAKSVFITDTALTSLDGINLATVDSFEITNNAYLRKIETQVGNISQALIINNNGPNLELTFPNLIWAFNMTVRNVSSLSIPSLKVVNSTFGVYGSYMESVMAPNLTKVGGDVAFVADSSLTNISMPLLETIGGGLLIANNSKLLDITGFPALKSAAGAISISGNFTKAAFPALADVQGTFNAQTSANFSCNDFNKLHDAQVVKGDVFCQAQSNNVQDTPSGSTSGQTDSGSSDSTKDAAGSLKVSSVFVVGMAVLGGLLALGAHRVSVYVWLCGACVCSSSITCKDENDELQEDSGDDYRPQENDSGDEEDESDAPPAKDDDEEEEDDAGCGSGDMLHSDVEEEGDESNIVYVTGGGVLC